MVDISGKDALWQFAWIPKSSSYIEQLKDSVIDDEEWSCPNFDGEDFEEKYLDEKYPLLDIYLRYTFRKLKQDYDKAPDDKKSAIISMNDDYAVFNTGLFTKYYEPVYMCFDKNCKPDKQPWHFKEYFAGTLPGYMQGLKLPERANYFVEPEKLIYDYNFPIELNSKHIIEDNLDRFPQELRDKYNTVELFEKLKFATYRTEKKLAGNYKLAVPQYYFKAEEVQLLVPIDLEDRGKVDIALAITKDIENHHYIARTCLKLQKAYSNARLIVKPESDWLHM